MTVSGNVVTIPLTNIANAQTINVRINGLPNGPTTTNLTIPMSILIGDTNANGAVNSADVSQTKGRLGQSLDRPTSGPTLTSMVRSIQPTSPKSRVSSALVCHSRHEVVPTIPRAREWRDGQNGFTVVFYGARNFYCKIGQFCEAGRESDCLS